MLIGGITKTTLLDYPEKVSCIIFTVGCNFRCGFCHNPELITLDKNNSPANCISEDDFFKFLKSRKNILDGVVISGGEPLLQKDIKNFIIKIRERDLLVKLDTNGTSPQKLQELVDLGLVDYVAMDIKTNSTNYPKVTQTKVDIKDIQKSIRFLLNGTVDYEFRTTIVDGLQTKEDLIELAKFITGAPKYFLQKFVRAPKLLDESFKNKKGLTTAELKEIAKICRQYVKQCEIR